ncbi:hypothetical protein [Planomonospora venezuelensis]|uniref:Lipoprotein n=1 Tax=Planomonospora venezuelensis TaxID=1999 RepID=A0A841CY08_PLAVE|nr:hypothetical protein [Planomonospora venezuelensis]MBB5960867.1 hypothetical protein [Planomonospora venezuelensis]GIN01101.1 hypothetical protein Pve01_27590 [Planomonospora venezuelensis]
MPRSSRRLPVRLGATLLVVALAAVGCGEKEPTAAEAGATLKNHILKLLDEVSAQNVQVTDPGKDIPCGDGKAKRTFAATGLDIAGQTKPRMLNIQMLGALSGFADYKMTGPGGEKFSVTSEATKTSLHMDSSADGQYTVRGETECLNRS